MECRKLIEKGSSSVGGGCGEASGPSICGGDVDGDDVIVGVVVDGSDDDPGEHGGIVGTVGRC